VIQSRYSESERSTSRWLIGFVFTQIACELLLAFVSAEGSTRILIRSSSFGIGLAYILLIRGGDRISPVRGWYLAVFATVLLGSFHPDSAGMLARLAQFLMYAAVLSPLIWAPHLDGNVKHLKLVLGAIWGFHTLSAFVGVLQVYFPGQFDTALSTAVANQGDSYVRSLQITLDSGEQILRPMGLSDVPGGAAYSGLYATVLGAGFLLFTAGSRLRLLFGASVALGIASIALSQVRAAAVDGAISIVALLMLLVLRGQFAKVVLVFSVVSVSASVGIALALSEAGEQVVSRYSTLVAESPDDVYRVNRGHFLESTLSNDLVDYPLGAGSGRWGMVSSYFGDADLDTEPLWAEIQASGWLYDGGVPLLLAYVGLLVATLLRVYKIARCSKIASVGDWATLVLAYDIGALALTFSYPLFVSQAGFEFWLFNSLVLGLDMRMPPLAGPKHSDSARPAGT
jgi:hypothetical protein